MEHKIDIYEILCNEWNCELEDLQTSLILNSDVSKVKAAMKDFAEKLLELAATESHDVYDRKSIRNCINQVNFE